MKSHHIAVFCLLTCPALAKAETLLVCSFPTLPEAVMRFPDDLAAKKTMQVGKRPPVVLTEGQGAGRIISAAVDGYTFQFVPANFTMDVFLKDKSLKSETGTCVTVGGPIEEEPLQITGLSEDEEPVELPLLASNGSWKVTEDRSAFDDSRTVVLSIESDDTVRGQFGPPGPALMYLRCMENATAVYLWINDLFLSDIQGFGVVDYRIDDRQASQLRAEGSTDNKALGLWSGGKSIPFIKEMLDGKRIAFRVTPFNESPVEFSFDLAGLNQAIGPLREACLW